MAKGGLWKDTSFEFPESITWSDLPNEWAIFEEEAEDIEWSRLSGNEHFSDYWMWGHDNVGHNDPVQGHIGDCWLVATASSIAEDPERLKEIFKVQEINNVGVCALKMFLLGTPITVTIDDYLPFDIDHPYMLLYSMISFDKGIWFPLF